MRTASTVRRFVRRSIAAATVLAVCAAAFLLIEALAVARLSPSVTDLPIRLYARPPVLHLGQRADPAGIAAHLSRVGYVEVADGRVRPGHFALGRRQWIIQPRQIDRLGSLASGRALLVRLDSWGRVVSIEDPDGQRYRAVPLEPELLAVESGARDRVQVRLEDLPAHLLDAVLTVEDQRFYQHHGIDYVRIAGAALANLRSGRVVQGGSTITQQLARTLYLDSRRTLIRKAREAAMSLVLELRHTKEEILEAYLNDVYLGQHSGLAVHGVGRAAETWLGKGAARVNLPEAALLAGLIRGPNLYAPVRRPKEARARRDLVLRLMLERGVIDEAERLEATAAPLPEVPAPSSPPAARYFADYVLSQLDGPDAGAAGPARGGAVITSLDAGLQRVAVAALADGLADLERAHPVLVERAASGGSRLQAALVAVDPGSGDVLAMVGGRDYGTSQFNRATHARRQPGSSFKPIVTLSAVSSSADGDGDVGPFTLATILSDEPMELETPAGRWKPVNYDGRFHGQVTLRDALERSLNVPFARLGVALGQQRIVKTARDLGIESRLAPYPSIALGAFEVTPFEMARAYGVLAAGGYRADTRAVLGVLGREGALVVAHEPGGRSVASPAASYLVTSALRGAVERGTGRALRAHGFAGAVAAKSGTTNGFRDGWFIGYTDRLAVAVWVGFDDGRSMGLSGSRAALPVFARFMAGATGRYGDSGEWGSDGFRTPRGLEVAEVDPVTGLRAGPGCRGRAELFIRGTAPRRSCSPYGFYSSGWAIADRQGINREAPALRSRRAP
jgi:penicillin-binding protein 1B